MNKKLILLLLISTLCSISFAFAEDSSTLLRAETVMANLEKNSIDMKLAQIKLDMARKASNDAQKEYDEKDTIHTQIASLKADNDVLASQQAYKNTLLNLKIQVGTLFTTAYELKETISFLESDLTIAKANQSKMKLKYDQGMITYAAYVENEKIVSELQKTLSNTVTAYHNSLMNIKKQAGIQADVKVEIEQYKNKFIAYNPTNIENLITESSKKSYKVAQAKRELVLAEQEYHAARSSVVNSTSAYYGLTEKKANEKDILANVELDLWTTYNTMKNLEDDVKLSDMDLKVATTNYQAAQINAKSGTITQNQLVEIEVAYKKKQLAQVAAVNKYMDAVATFKNKIE